MEHPEIRKTGHALQRKRIIHGGQFHGRSRQMLQGQEPQGTLTELCFHPNLTEPPWFGQRDVCFSLLAQQHCGGIRRMGQHSLGQVLETALAVTGLFPLYPLPPEF